MADQEVQNGGAEKAIAEAKGKTTLDLIVELAVEAPKAEDAVQFYKAVFDAVEIERATYPKRKADQERPLLLSALLQFGGNKVMVNDRLEDDFKAPEPGSKHQNIGLRLVSEQDVEAVIEKAVAAGAVAEGGVAEDRVLPGKHLGKVRDPFGIVWTIVGNTTKTFAAENDTAAVPEARILL
ncbi:hypothetical protein M0R45_010163 [Rubus argutus]|uniref:VOC domain-containing protein n=1 Tax=Rubus argutus TaxID=59490 RepID=A0AAW1Y6Z2_RUBAR